MNAIFLLMPSGPELILIVAIILLLFGGRKIPELMRGLGKGVKEFKNASEGVEDIKKEINKTASDVNTKAEKDDSSKDKPAEEEKK